MVLAPFYRDRHPDHAASGHLVKEAVYLAGVKKVGSGGVFRPERLFHYMIHQPFTPSFIVDITTVWQRKNANTLDWQPLTTFGSKGSGEGEFKSPIGLRLLDDLTVWVADSGNSRLSIWQRCGVARKTRPVSRAAAADSRTPNSKRHGSAQV